MKVPARFNYGICLALLMAAWAPGDAFSQISKVPGFTAPAVPAQPVTPSPVQVPMPKLPENKTAAQSSIPPLPPSDPCKASDMAGLWRLVRVYEVPVGKELSAYATNPMQYLFFKSNNTFARYNTTSESPPVEVMQQLNRYNGPLLQFVVQQGMMYFYQEQKVNDTQACFIVHTQQGPFVRGQMMLMPPKGQIQGRLIKLYQHASELWAQSHPQSGAQPNTPQQRIQQLQQQRLQSSQPRNNPGNVTP